MCNKYFSQINCFLLYSCSVMSDSSQPHGLQHPWLPLVHHQLPQLAQTHVHRVSDAIQPSHLLSSPSHPAFNFPSIKVFSSESALCIRRPKYWSFSVSISPFIEYSGLISFKIDWFDLLAVQQTLKSLLNHYNLRESILWCYSLYGPTLISVHA